jgi:hypothetical protein
MGQPESFHFVALGQIVESRRLLKLAQLLSFFTAIDVEEEVKKRLKINGLPQLP